MTTRSRGGIADAIARINVVFPEFIAPPTTMFFRARTAAARKLARVTIETAHLDQIVQSQIDVSMTPDRHDRSLDHRHQSRESTSVWEPQIQLGMRDIESSL